MEPQKALGGRIMDYVKLLSELDINPTLHKSRLLILLYVFAGDKNTESIEGITKLAKLDFLLRYPVMLKRALDAKGVSSKGVMIQENEINSVESEMVRYRFGPWDHNYRFYLNLLVGEGLVKITAEGRTVVITLTNQGFSLAETLCDEPLFEIYKIRSEILKRHFNLTSTNLMKFIYETFPEIISLNSGKRITL